MREAAIAFTTQKGAALTSGGLPFALRDIPRILVPAGRFLFGVRRLLGPARSEDDVWTAAEELAPAFHAMARRSSELRHGRRPPVSSRRPAESSNNPLLATLGYAAQSIAAIKAAPGETLPEGDLPPFIRRLGLYLELLPIPVSLAGLERVPNSELILPTKSRLLCVDAAQAAMAELIAFSLGLGVRVPPPPPGVELPEPMDVDGRLREWREVQHLRAAQGHD